MPRCYILHSYQYSRKIIEDPSNIITLGKLLKMLNTIVQFSSCPQLCICQVIHNNR